MTRPRRLWGATCFVLAACPLLSAPAVAADAPPPASLALRDTADVWTGEGIVALNKLQISGTLEGRYLGFEGWRLHGQIYRTDGQSLSRRVGDLQTVDNIEAISATRLFEAWVERSFGPQYKPVAALRIGLIDLNADFDATDPASLFINSSHGIGPDLSRSGRDGPSIFPVSALGARLTWNASDKLTLKSAVFNGVPGDPTHRRAFAAEQLSAADGAMLIGEADAKLTDVLTLAAGAWGYTRPLQPAFAAGGAAEASHGIYAALSTATPKDAGWAWWVRGGADNPDAQVVANYLGGGLIYKGVLGRPDDRVGFAIARAGIGRGAQQRDQLPAVETTLEASYQAKLGQRFAVQPDLQYVVHPAGRSDRRNALVFGFRLIVTGGYPTKAKPEDATDPTVPPDTPASPDAPAPAAN